MEKRENKCLWMLKVISCLTVILFHCPIQGLVGDAIIYALIFPIPIFLMISGYYSLRKDASFAVVWWIGNCIRYGGVFSDRHNGYESSWRIFEDRLDKDSIIWIYFQRYAMVFVRNVLGLDIAFYYIENPSWIFYFKMQYHSIACGTYLWADACNKVFRY